jgi:hypothetical protein
LSLAATLSLPHDYGRRLRKKALFTTPKTAAGFLHCGRCLLFLFALVASGPGFLLSTVRVTTVVLGHELIASFCDSGAFKSYLIIPIFQLLQHLNH